MQSRHHGAKKGLHTIGFYPTVRKGVVSARQTQGFKFFQMFVLLLNVHIVIQEIYGFHLFPKTIAE